MKTRVESDSMGSIVVPEKVYWGAQTQRSLIHFSIGNDLIPKEVIRAMAIVKLASAKANYDLGILPLDKRDLIIKIATEIIEGKLDSHFPLHVWMTGSGTQSNMNVNEVISNRACEISGTTLGSKNPLHPNDHVNMSQSSNDVFPTAMHISAVLGIKQMLIVALNKMIKSLEKKSLEWSDIVKIGRTHMQDAVPITLGQEFSGYSALLKKGIKRIEKSIPNLFELAIGGTAVGTGINAPKVFGEKAASYISKETNLPFNSAENKFEVMGSHDALIEIMTQIKIIAVSLFKIANDIRLLTSGPRAGFNELLIPQNEPGSSIMPGKVNPTQCEALAMVCVQIMGYDTAVTIAGSSGYLEMNVYKPMIIFNVINSIHLISNSLNNFTEFLLEGMTPNKEKIDFYLNNSLMLVTILSPIIGYEQASKIANYANDNNCSLRDANKHFQILSDSDFIKYVNPYQMTKGGRIEQNNYEKQ